MDLAFLGTCRACQMNLNRISKQFDLESFLQDHGFRELNNSEWIGLCPECGKSKLAVNTNKRQWHCWVCQDSEDSFDPITGTWSRKSTHGAGGVLRLIQWLEGVEFKEAVEIARLNGGAIQPIHQIKPVQKIEPRPTMFRPVDPPEFAAPIPETGLPFLQERGITTADVTQFGLFWCPMGRYANRLVFPVWDDQGRLIYWQARAMYPEAEAPPNRRFIKVLNPPKTEGCAVSSEVLGNLQQARHYPRVCLVEGPIDAVHVGPDAVWTFGKKLHTAQISRLLEAGVRAVDLMWDGPTPSEPDGAHPEMLRIAPQLACYFDVRLCFISQGDPGDHPRETLSALRATGVPFSSLSRTAQL